MRKLCGLLILGAWLLMGSLAVAKTTESVPGEYDAVWSTAVKLIRVDYDMKVVDKDKDAGFVIFLYKDNRGKESRATLEITHEKTDDKSAASQRIVVNIPGASSLEERAFITDLRRKLRD